MTRKIHDRAIRGKRAKPDRALRDATLGQKSITNLEEYKNYLAEIGVEVSAPSAASLGVPEATTQQVETFFAHLQHNHDGKRVVNKVLRILPSNARDNLARFVMTAMHASIEQAFVNGRRERGQKILPTLRAQGRAGLVDEVVMQRAEAAFDTRWMGLSNCFMFLMVQVYVQCRAGILLRPKDWDALTAAACAAAGTVRMIDGEVLARNLRNLAKWRPALIPSGAQVIEKIEGVKLSRIVFVGPTEKGN